MRVPAKPLFIALIWLVLLLLGGESALTQDPTAILQQTASLAEDFPANQWVLLHREDRSGGKAFARAIFAPTTGQVYLWGTGGKKLARNLYQRYELEAFDPKEPGWFAAFPAARRGQWTADSFPPFRIYGQSGPDGLKYDQGPRLQVVGGYHHTNRIRWWDFDGVKRPSPVLTFNMACWDSRRDRMLFYSDGVTFALDPGTNSWTDLQAKNHPTTCRSLAWASMCYDPSQDRVLLFGGGLATNPVGAAPTWFYDCQSNTWQRPRLDVEPPPRCNAPIVYDPATNCMVLFGGYNQAAALNDTWVFDCQKNRWQQRRPQLAPPPMSAPAAAALSPGRTLVCGHDARRVRWHHRTSSSALKETWVYDVKQNTWIPRANLELPGYGWLTATNCGQDVVLMVAFGPERRTYALRYHASKTPLELPGAEPGTVAWKYPEQQRSLEEVPGADPQAQAQKLKALPVNEFVDAQPPGLLISKTWSTAVMDTDRSQVIYTGGGHSGYSGNDFASYSVAENRWRLDFPPRFPPFLEGTNAGIYGWSYGMIPFSQHTYLWYCYDPVSQAVLYLARPSIRDGAELQLTNDPDDVLVYEAKKHGYASWVYDPVAQKMRRPSFGRTFDNPWHLSLVGTPQGVYAMCRNRLYRAKVDRQNGQVEWFQEDQAFPEPRQPIKYHYEFQPIVYDSQRDRLVQLKGDQNRVDVYVRPLKESGKWEQLTTQGNAAIGREAVYIAGDDTILWLGEKLFALDCATGQMGELDVSLPQGSYGHECAFVYDPKHNVCVALIPASFTGPMQTFLFRFDPTTAKYR